MATERNRSIAKEILQGIATQVVRDGGRVEWGTPANRKRAIYLAAKMGHRFDPHCQSCDSDLFMVIKHAAK